jgi:hypothetical protein
VGSSFGRDPIGVAALTAVRSERTGGFGPVDSDRPETLILSLLISEWRGRRTILLSDATEPVFAILSPLWALVAPG